MSDQTFVVPTEIPVTDMAKAMEFYNQVFGWTLTLDTSGPNPMAIYGGAPGVVGGHLYPGTPGAGPTIHLAVPDGLAAATDRLFQIVQHLRGGRLITAATLADRLEVSTRTIYRDIADLIGSGVPIEGEAGIGYVMRQVYDLPPLMFTRDEIAALVAGARLLRAWAGTAMAAAAEEALVKINEVLPDSARARADSVQVHAIGMSAMTPDLRDRLDQVDRACNDRLRLHLRYLDEAGEASNRLVRPLGLYFWGKVWTLLAWCELRQDFRTFRLDRVAAMTLGDRFRPERDKSAAAYYEIQRRQGRIPD
ncbi:WYL domain-containing protein [Pseudooceanicola sp.]|uniref:WYL domain-containing protein n=1 Tax=Pseudooceanicola sp. TaxID=1914328 RepID=UPI00262EE324|nr:WYL domain-containing protein [Pseudooceanicola sp.]MDF1856636.1 WYL domain-containing protein [Pseudooceanicola sp.]